MGNHGIEAELRRLREVNVKQRKALEKAQFALTWSTPEGGACCAGNVTQKQAARAHEDATEAVQDALGT